jgi:tetratricopeptide (TPR) repeat protein
MKRFLVFAFALVFTASSAHAADAVARAMRLYERGHYDEAASVLRAPGLSKQGAANLALGMVYLKNAVLHRELYAASLSVSREYLEKLSAIRGRDRSRFAHLYFGDALMEEGKPDSAAASYKKFSREKGISNRYREIANVGRGLCYQMKHEGGKAASLWSRVDASDPEVKAELAAAYSKAGLTDKAPVLMADACLAKAGKSLSARMVKNLLSVYAKAGLTEKGLAVLGRADLKANSYRESLGASKVIRFYDPSFLNDMATLYGQAAVSSLEKAAGDPKVSAAAEFYLCRALTLFGPVDRSLEASASFLAAPRMPEQYKDLVLVWRGANVYRKSGHITGAIGIWDELLRKRPGDRDLLAEIITACGVLKIGCPLPVEKGAAMAESGDRKKNTVLNIALGSYYLGNRDDARAVAYLEAGRDKSNKNKIEANDAEMLVRLAEAYFRTKKYPEALEIYFGMSGQFPEVRQIQEAMQGVYAMEHRSAGDVKIN